MPGQVPKPAALRQRQNKTSTRAILSAEQAVTRRAPMLPKHREWNKLTRAWWTDVWHSPMASEFLESDIHGLHMLAELIDRFWEEPTVSLSAEIRLQRQCFGLTPIDRRRLQWEVERVEAVTRKMQPLPSIALRDVADDPRRNLTVLS